MPDPVCKMLRDEIARLIGHKKLKHEFRSEMSQDNPVLRVEIVDLKTENMKLKGVNRYHENPYTSIIKQSLGAEKKGRGKRNNKPVKRPRRKTHHRGVSYI